MRTLAAILIAGVAMANVALGTGWFLMGEYVHFGWACLLFGVSITLWARLTRDR